MTQRAIGTMAILFVMLTPALMAAQGRGKAAPPQGPKATAQGPRTTGSGAKPATRGPNPTPAGKPASAGKPKSAGGAKPARTDTRRPADARTPTTTTTAPSSTTTPSALPKNPRLVERLRTMLPDGTDMSLAAAGFRNQGQFVAAVQVSHNLGIPFAELKTRMVTDEMSLGRAIQDLRPTADADAEARRATRQADEAIKSADEGASRPRG
jgi:hypothetical protein